MRYFIGIGLPKAHRQTVEALRRQLGFSSTLPHITLIPPPDLPDDLGFADQLVPLCQEFSPFTVTPGAADHFGRRVVYIGVDAPPLNELYRQARRVLGLPRETKPYHPHITVVKERPGRPIDFEEALARGQCLPGLEPFIATGITIFAQPYPRAAYLPDFTMRFGTGERQYDT